MLYKKGFTLVELVIVVAIIGILASFAIPEFMSAREAAATKECIANRTQIMRMFNVQRAIDGKFTLALFLQEALKENNKYFNIVPRCADKGEYSVNGEIVVCSIERHNEDKRANNSAVDDLYEAIKDALLNNKDLPPSWDNDGWREYILGLLGKEDWDQANIDGILFDVTFHMTKDGAGNVFPLIYLSNGTKWDAQYIYNAKTDKWYHGPTVNLAGAKDKTIEDIITDVTGNKGWTEVPDPQK